MEYLYGVQNLLIIMYKGGKKMIVVQHEMLYSYQNYKLLEQRKLLRHEEVKHSKISMEAYEGLDDLGKDVVVLIDNFNVDIINNEYSFIVGYDKQHFMRSVYLMSVGDENAASFYPKKVATYILLSGYNGYMLYHNHPNTILQFSEGDKEIASDMEDICQLLECNFLGSVIITIDGYLSNQKDSEQIWFPWGLGEMITNCPDGDDDEEEDE